MIIIIIIILVVASLAMAGLEERLFARARIYVVHAPARG